MRDKTLARVKWIVAGCVLLVLTTCTFITGMAFEGRVYSLFSPAMPIQPPPIVTQTGGAPREFATFWEAWNTLNQEFYGPIPPDNERVYGAIRGLVHTFGDQHTIFIDPTHAAINRDNRDGTFEGIGSTIRLDDKGQLMVVDVSPNQPAFRAGLRQGDRVLAIDGQSVEGLGVYEVVTAIRGAANTPVIITIMRPGEPGPRDIQVIRARIEIELVQAKLLPQQIGYLRLAQFSEGAGAKLHTAMQGLIQQGATQLILDLRSNPGGLLNEAVNVGSLFMDGVIVIERLKSGEEKTFMANSSGYKATSLPLVVLVNTGSASASEIVAGAVQDSQRGAIIGEQSFGKGSVQIPHELADGSELRVTVAEWLTPLRRHIHKQGITPDVVVKQTSSEVEQGRDPQLDKAIEYLSRK